MRRQGEGQIGRADDDFQGTPRRQVEPRAKSKECTLGVLLRQLRLSRGLSLRKVSFSAGFTPTYLSLLERDACGPPSDEKLQALAAVLGEAHAETLFAKAGRVTPRVVSIILQHPTQWSDLLESGKHLNADHIESLKEKLNEKFASGDFPVLGMRGIGRTTHIQKELHADFVTEKAKDYPNTTAAATKGVSAASRLAQLEKIIEAAEKEAYRRRTSHIKNRARKPKSAPNDATGRKEIADEPPTPDFLNQAGEPGHARRGRSQPE